MPSNVSKTFYFSGNQKKLFAYFKAIGTIIKKDVCYRKDMLTQSFHKSKRNCKICEIMLIMSKSKHIFEIKPILIRIIKNVQIP